MGDFNASDDTEIPLTLSGYLPTAGVEFSKQFRQLHAQYMKQCLQKPLDENKSPYLEAFRSDLYSCNSDFVHDLFSFIKVKRKSETKLNVGVLTPEKAIEYFIKFLQGDYCRNNSRDLAKAVYTKMKQLEPVRQNGEEFQLFLGIYEILLVAAKEKTPSSKILFSLQKITEYAKHNTDQTMIFMAPLLQSKYFRNLFSQALHYYWLSESPLDETYTKAFNGEEETKSLIERLKSILSENRSASKSYGQVAKLLRYVRLLYKLEQDINKSEGISTSNRAIFYREKAFHLLDWLPSLEEFADRAIIVNIWLQIGITIQRAAAEEPNPVLCMADEKLATQIFAGATIIAQHATPDVELYACLHSLKCLPCRYTDSEFKKILEALQHRALWIADLFPFFQTPQSNVGFYEHEDKNLVLMSRLLHALIDKIDNKKNSVEKSVIDHSHVRVFYQAYEACVKNWYEKSHNLETENKFRQQLMVELLVSKQWTVDDINYNLNAPWPLSYLDEQGWTCPESSILPLVKKANIQTFKTVRGVEINYKTGEIDFFLDYCEENESDHNRLLTFFDLSELFQHCLKDAIFSLDPVDPDMPYHPFNQMRFKPSTLYHSQLLHTMFITDYLLKFLTVGQEVQRRDPYEFRCLDRIIAKLPDHLKEVIYNFHASNHKESLSRFWIESEEVELAIDNEDESENILFALGNIRMVVKHHKMERDAEGNLVDKEGENEGWDCYILTEEQKQELCDGKRVISDSAIIIIKESWELNIWENNKITHRFILEEDEYDLKNLSNRERDSQEKIKTDDSESLRQIYRIVLKAAEKTGMPHRFTPEFVFAQEFTKFYDEFAIYFHEFGRLRELSKALCLVSIMAAQREKNQEIVNLIKRRLLHKRFCGLRCRRPAQVEEHNYWETTRKQLKELVTKGTNEQFEEWRGKFSKEKLQQKSQEILNDLRSKIGTLKFTRSSPEIKDICDELYENIKSNYIAKNGYFSWWFLDKSREKIYREFIDPEIPSLISRLENKKKTACREQLLKLFKDELDELSEIKAKQLVDSFLDEDDEPLLEQLVYHSRVEVSEKIKKIYPEHTINILDKALNNTLSAINEVVNCEYGKVLEKHEEQLKVHLSGREKLEKTFIDLGFGSGAEEINLDGTCLWVPASFRRDIEKGHSRTVYGGVCITGRVLKYADQNRMKALARATRKEAKQMHVNYIVGNAANDFVGDIVKQWLSPHPRFRARVNDRKARVKTPYGMRYHDIVIEEIDENGVFRPVLGVEIKSGKEKFKEKQRRHDAWTTTYLYPVIEIRVGIHNKDEFK